MAAAGWMAARSLDAVPTAPGLGDLTQDAQFADVVGIVVGHDQHLPQHGVLVVAWDRAEEVRPVIDHDADNRSEVPLERTDTLIPLVFRRPRVLCRPVVPR